MLTVKARRPNFRFPVLPTKATKGMAASYYNPSTGSSKMQSLGACWPSGLDSTVSFRFTERPCFKSTGVQ